MIRTVTYACIGASLLAVGLVFQILSWGNVW